MRLHFGRRVQQQEELFAPVAGGGDGGRPSAGGGDGGRRDSRVRPAERAKGGNGTTAASAAAVQLSKLLKAVREQSLTQCTHPLCAQCRVHTSKSALCVVQAFTVDDFLARGGVANEMLLTQSQPTHSARSSYALSAKCTL